MTVKKTRPTDVQCRVWLFAALVCLCAMAFASAQNTAVDSAGAPLKAAAGPASGAARPDTALKSHLRDSLENEIRLQKQRFLSYPVSLDSIFAFDKLLPHQVMKSDAIGLSDLLRLSPRFVSTPFSLSSSLNRFMFYGFPLLPNATVPDNSMFSESPNSLRGSDDVFSTQCYSLTLNSPAVVGCTQFTQGLLSPHTGLLWENGVFLENIFGVRFARPLSKTIDIGVYSNNRYFAPRTYSTASEIQTLYEYYFRDTSLISYGGRNPLSDEHIAQLTLSSHTKSGQNASFSYTYEDCTNEQAMQLQDSLGSSDLLWKKISRFSNTASLRLTSLRTPLLASDLEARAVIEGHTASVPLTAQSITFLSQSGKNSDISAGWTGRLPAGSDTVLFILDATRNERGLYSNKNIVSFHDNARLGFGRYSSLMGIGTLLHLTCGDGMSQGDNASPLHSLVYSADMTATAGRQSLHAFALRDRLPFVLPYDTLLGPWNSYEDLYSAYGAELCAGYKEVGLTTGICAVSGTDTAEGGRFWPGGILPYAQPGLSAFVNPMFGRLLGFAVSCRIMVSDTKPHVKSQTILSYEANPLQGKEHIVTDLMFDYWSVRDPVSFGGIDTWNRELFNLSLKTSVHIQAFNLFYKVDNILNRKFAYIPGYFMPGLTFRWGFGWLIQG